MRGKLPPESNSSSEGNRSAMVFYVTVDVATQLQINAGLRTSGRMESGARLDAQTNT
jgi:hypothetical protein